MHYVILSPADFRRWTRGLHKATHHFDLLNWWIDSEPTEVFAYGALEHYGKNGLFRGKNCRSCEHKSKCSFYWDITTDKHLMKLYVENEHHDGYIRDNCLFRPEIDICDKMPAQLKYANNVMVNYILTTYSPFEGWRIAFNGMEGRIEAWEDILWLDESNLSQAERHAREMNQTVGQSEFRSIIVHKNWKEFGTETVQYEREGHGGGDKRMQDKIFIHPEDPDLLGHAAGSLDGAMSILIGIAARKSIESGKTVKIGDLTALKPKVKRG